MEIITKFTVATEQGVDVLMELTQALAVEKLGSLLAPDVLDHHIRHELSKEKLVIELNSMSNQWLVAYVDGRAAGYARITSKGQKPASLQGGRSIRIADFGILAKYSTSAVYMALLDKCLSVCRSYENIWVQEYVDHPVLELLEEHGFVQQEGSSVLGDLPLASVFLVRTAIE